MITEYLAFTFICNLLTLLTLKQEFINNMTNFT